MGKEFFGEESSLICENKRGSHVSNGGWHFFHWSATDCWCLYRMVGSEWLVWIESVSTTIFFFFLKHEGRWRGRKKQDYLEKTPDNQPSEQVSNTETGSEPRASPWRWRSSLPTTLPGVPLLQEWYIWALKFLLLCWFTGLCTDFLQERLINPWKYMFMLINYRPVLDGSHFARRNKSLGRVCCRRNVSGKEINKIFTDGFFYYYYIWSLISGWGQILG